MKVNITVEMNNSAFEDDPCRELGRIFQDLTHKLAVLVAPPYYAVEQQRKNLINQGSISLLDVNGNPVGTARFSE